MSHTRNFGPNVPLHKNFVVKVIHNFYIDLQSYINIKSYDNTVEGLKVHTFVGVFNLLTVVKIRQDRCQK